MPPTWVSLLAIALSSVPQDIQVVQQALNDHWGKDHVQQLVKGADYLAELAQTIAGVASVKTTPVMPQQAP